MAINASIQTALVEGVSLPHSQQVSPMNLPNDWGSSSANPTHNGWGSSARPSANSGSNGLPVQPTHNEATKARPNAVAPQLHTTQTETPIVSHSSQAEAAATSTVPSAPPLSGEMIDQGPILYPSIDSTPVEFTVPPVEKSVRNSSEAEEDGGSTASSSSTCVICLDKPVEGACIPCGHMAGCMACLKEIKEKRGECPVCRAKINQVVRLYAV